MKRFCVFLMLFIFLFPALSRSTTYKVKFKDTRWFWPGWNNRDPHDQKDVISHPDFYGGRVLINADSTLFKIVFSFEEWQDGWPYKFTDLFIDINADYYWDYVVKLFDGENGTIEKGNYSIYKLENVSIYDQEAYVYSFWSGGNYRNDHPIAIKSDYLSDENLVGEVFFSGIIKTDNKKRDVARFKFENVTIPLASEFIIAWTVHCANDVVFEKIKNPIPEPSSLILCGVGLVSIGFVLRLKKKK